MNAYYILTKKYYKFKKNLLYMRDWEMGVNWKHTNQSIHTDSQVSIPQ